MLRIGDRHPKSPARSPSQYMACDAQRGIAIRRTFGHPSQLRYIWTISPKANRSGPTISITFRAGASGRKKNRIVRVKSSSV
jgi:hypothetical protein